MKALFYASLLGLTGIASCSFAEMIKAWLVTPDTATPPECLKYNSLQHKTSKVNEMLTLLQAKGYRCYSPQDDEAWRTRLATCEAGK